TEMTTQAFGGVAKRAVVHAYEAMENPVEGTMLTVIREWAHRAEEVCDDSLQFSVLFDKSIPTAERALERTKEELQVLRTNNVVDAGALGFVQFLKGFSASLRGEAPMYSTGETEALALDHVHEEESAYRYCTEMTVQGVKGDRKALQALLKEFGDSVIVAGGDGTFKVHVHTDEPAALTTRLQQFGTIVRPKVDDMHMQSRVKETGGPIALVTDSIADLPAELVDAYNIFQVPIELQIGESTYLDRRTLTSRHFYNMDTNGLSCSSSQPSRRTVESLYSYLTSHYASILVITVSKGMSGTYNAFQKSAETLAASGYPIRVIDSKQNSAAQGLIVLEAAERIARGEAFADVCTHVERLVDEARILVSVSSLDGMVRSGRIPQTVGRLLSLVNLKPIVSIDADGKGALIGKAFSMKQNTAHIEKLIQQHLQNRGIRRYAIVHGAADARLDAWLSKFETLIGKKPDYVTEVSSVIAMSAAENTIAIAFLEGES
ncbi:MAG: DegV family protein, partial [Bacilli bacterium]